jgi:hypothetical protein
MRAMVEARIAAMVAATQRDSVGQQSDSGEEHDGEGVDGRASFAHLPGLRKGAPARNQGSRPPPQYSVPLETGNTSARPQQPSVKSEPEVQRSQQPSPESVKPEPEEQPLYSKPSAFAAVAHDELLVEMGRARDHLMQALLDDEEDGKEMKEPRVGVEKVEPCTLVEPASFRADNSQSRGRGQPSAISSETFCSDDDVRQAPSHDSEPTNVLHGDAATAVLPRRPRQFARRNMSSAGLTGDGGELPRLEKDLEPPPTPMAAASRTSLTLDVSGIAGESSVV